MLGDRVCQMGFVRLDYGWGKARGSQLSCLWPPAVVPSSYASAPCVLNRFRKGCKPNSVCPGFYPGERIICLSSQYPGLIPHCGKGSEQLQSPLFGLAPDGVFRASVLTLGAVVSYTTFSPLPERLQTQSLGPRRFIFCGTVRRDASRHRLPRVSPTRLSCLMLGYAASRPSVFGLSSPGSRRKRFSAFPKSSKVYRSCRGQANQSCRLCRPTRSCPRL